MPIVDVTTTYLEMLDPARLRPRACPSAGWQVRQPPRDFETNRDYYRDVGSGWNWYERLSWSDDRWRQYVERDNLETWLGYLDDAPIGYFELEDEIATGVELAYFGLLPGFIGRGLGGVLLTEAIRRAWQRKPNRVWVHACTLDHPQAIANYLARGFEIYKTETLPQLVP